MKVKAKVFLGVDYGKKRTGLALSATGVFALPLTVIVEGSFRRLVAGIVEVALKHQVDCIVVGMPYSLSGEQTQMSSRIDRLILELRRHLPKLEVVGFDERYTTRLASFQLQDVGHDMRAQKPYRDMLAATLILNCYLEKIHQEN